MSLNHNVQRLVSISTPTDRDARRRRISDMHLCTSLIHRYIVIVVVVVVVVVVDLNTDHSQGTAAIPAGRSHRRDELGAAPGILESYAVAAKVGVLD
jgi:hypothetical protein